MPISGEYSGWGTFSGTAGQTVHDLALKGIQAEPAYSTLKPMGKTHAWLPTDAEIHAAIEAVAGGNVGEEQLRRHTEDYRQQAARLRLATRGWRALLSPPPW
jgi:hypothetical protein